MKDKVIKLSGVRAGDVISICDTENTRFPVSMKVSLSKPIKDTGGIGFTKSQAAKLAKALNEVAGLDGAKDAPKGGNEDWQKALDLFDGILEQLYELDLYPENPEEDENPGFREQLDELRVFLWEKGYNKKAKPKKK